MEPCTGFKDNEPCIGYESCNGFSDIESCIGFYAMEPCKGFYGMWKQTTFDSNFTWQFLEYYDTRFTNMNISFNFYSK